MWQENPIANKSPNNSSNAQSQQEKKPGNTREQEIECLPVKDTNKI